MRDVVIIGSGCAGNTVQSRIPDASMERLWSLAVENRWQRVDTFRTRPVFKIGDAERATRHNEA